MKTNMGQHNEFAFVLQFITIFVYSIHIIIKNFDIIVKIWSVFIRNNLIVSINFLYTSISRKTDVGINSYLSVWPNFSQNFLTDLEAEFLQMISIFPRRSYHSS